MPAPSIRSPGHKENEDKAVRISEVWQGKIKIFYEFSPSSVEHGALIFHFLWKKNSVCIIWRKSLGMQLTSRCGLPHGHLWVILCAWLPLHTLIFRYIRKGAKPNGSRIVSAPDTGVWYEIYSYSNIWKYINPSLSNPRKLVHVNWSCWGWGGGQSSWQSLSPSLPGDLPHQELQQTHKDKEVTQEEMSILVVWSFHLGKILLNCDIYDPQEKWDIYTPICGGESILWHCEECI